MDRKTLVDGPKVPAAWVGDGFDAVADQLSSTARHALGGCVFGLTPDLTTSTVRPGEAYHEGNRLRLRAAEDIDIAGLTRPSGSEVAWVAIFASYATDGSLTVTDNQGVQHVLCVNDGIVISVERGIDAADRASAIKPAIPSGSIVLCDILLDATTAVSGLTGDKARRTQCPDDRLLVRLDGLAATVDAIAAAALQAAAAPNKGPTPAATSTVSLRIDATWAAGSVPSGAPAINRYQLRWAQAGENWTAARTIDLLNVRMAMFSVPDANSDVEMEVSAGNSNGFGAWSDTGTIDAGDIASGPPLMTRTFVADEDWSWPYSQTGRARVTLHGGDGGDGGGGGRGGRGNTSGARNSGGKGGGLDGGIQGSTINEADGGDGTNRGGGGGGAAGNGLGFGGDGGNGGGSGGSATGTAVSGGGGGGGGGPAGGDGGAGSYSPGYDVSSVGGGGGGGGEQGESGSASSIVVATRGVSQSAAGGAGGSGGGGGGGGHAASDGHDGDDGGDGAGGAGGTATDRPGIGSDGGQGGAGGAGIEGTERIVDIVGLQEGDAVELVIGTGGSGGVGGSGAGGPGTSSLSGTAGAAGWIRIEPLAA